MDICKETMQAIVIKKQITQMAIFCVGFTMMFVALFVTVDDWSRHLAIEVGGMYSIVYMHLGHVQPQVESLKQADMNDKLLREHYILDIFNISRIFSRSESAVFLYKNERNSNVHRLHDIIYVNQT